MTQINHDCLRVQNVPVPWNHASVPLRSVRFFSRDDNRAAATRTKKRYFLLKDELHRVG